MKGLAKFFLQNRALSWLLLVLILGGGIFSYYNMGKLEDAPFTIKQAVVTTSYPGASPMEVQQQVTDVLEEAIQSLGELYYLKTDNRAGLSKITVYVKKEIRADEMQQLCAAGRSEHVQIVAYGEDRVEPWWEGNKGDFAKIGKLTVVSVPDDQVTALASMASRNMKLAVTIQDGILWISDDRDSLQIEVTVLQTEHERYSDF